MLFTGNDIDILLSEIPLPNEQARLEILKIHAQPIAKQGEIGEIYFYALMFPEFFQVYRICHDVFKIWQLSFEREQLVLFM